MQAFTRIQYEVIYLADTQFSRFDVYRQIAQNFGLDPHYRFAQLWRDIKNHIRERVENKSSMPILILDESQNLPPSFFQSLPSFLNFNFDSQDMLIVWLVGHPELVHILNRLAYVAGPSRIQVRHHLEAVDDTVYYSQLIYQAFKEAGATTSLHLIPGIELLRTSSRENPGVRSSFIDTYLSSYHRRSPPCIRYNFLVPTCNMMIKGGHL